MSSTLEASAGGILLDLSSSSKVVREIHRHIVSSSIGQPLSDEAIYHRRKLTLWEDFTIKKCWLDTYVQQIRIRHQITVKFGRNHRFVSPSCCALTLVNIFGFPCNFYMLLSFTTVRYRKWNNKIVAFCWLMVND